MCISNDACCLLLGEHAGEKAVRHSSRVVLVAWCFCEHAGGKAVRHLSRVVLVAWCFCEHAGEKAVRHQQV